MTQKQRSIAIYSMAAVLLAIPFIAMKFTQEVNWSGFDFLIAGTLLFSTAFIINLVLNKVKTNGKRMFLVLVILLVLFLIWAELAVGLFGTPFAGS